jgi:hypothetical protein
MTIRRRDDSIKPGKGIDGDSGSDFTKQHRVSPWASNRNDDYLSPQGAGAYQDENADFLRNKPPGAGTGGTGESLQGGSHDIWDAVEGQSSDSGNRAVKSRGQP